MNNQNTGKRLRERLLGSVSLAIFGFMTFVTVLTANALGAETWFSTVMGIAVGVLSYCCLRTWLDEDVYDSPDSNVYVILAGALAFICMMLAYITMQIFPFGDHTVLIIDMHHQYVAFFALLRDKITSFGSFIYSDS
ncbi:MAG: YfhO family protein, partial [Clostridia bacterium]|nr:YfhO family protein [Clostridia bacterium]